MPGFALPLAAALAVALAIALVAFVAWPLGRGAVERLSHARVARPEVQAVLLSGAETSSPVVTGGSYRYVLTEKQALESFERAKDRFQEYRDNAALVEINRLQNSNANEGIKSKARSLKAFVGKPDFRTVKDAPSLAEVGREPWLYDGCSVIWKGMATNVRRETRSGKAASGHDSVAFDFLVGYQDKKKLEGIARAVIDDAEVPVDRALELLAVIRAEGEGYMMDCQAVHELLK
jgi:hypothetical protein